MIFMKYNPKNNLISLQHLFTQIDTVLIEYLCATFIL